VQTDARSVVGLATNKTSVFDAMLEHLQLMSRCEEEALAFLTRPKESGLTESSTTNHREVTSLPMHTTPPPMRTPESAIGKEKGSEHYSLANTFYSFKQTGRTKVQPGLLHTPSLGVTHETAAAKISLSSSILLPAYDNMSKGCCLRKREIFALNERSRQIETRERHPDYPLVSVSPDLQDEIEGYKRELRRARQVREAAFRGNNLPFAEFVSTCVKSYFTIKVTRGYS
jgi:hypothetical protein